MSTLGTPLDAESLLELQPARISTATDAAAICENRRFLCICTSIYTLPYSAIEYGSPVLTNQEFLVFIP